MDVGTGMAGRPQAPSPPGGFCQRSPDCLGSPHRAGAQPDDPGAMTKVMRLMVLDPGEQDYGVHKLLVDRWSPCSFDARAVPAATLDTIFEAADFAPSAFTVRPRTFLFARRDNASSERLLSLLVFAYGSWAMDASVPILIGPHNMLVRGNNPAPSHTCGFDIGDMWAQLAVAGHGNGLIHSRHEWRRFYLGHELIRKPERFRPEAVLVIGRQAWPDRPAVQYVNLSGRTANRLALKLHSRAIVQFWSGPAPVARRDLPADARLRRAA